MTEKQETIGNKQEIIENKLETQETASEGLSDDVILMIADGFREQRTQKAIAELTGLSPGYLSRIKKRALTGKYENLLPIKDAIEAAADPIGGIEDEIIEKIREALKPRKSRSVLASQLLILTPTEKRILEADNPDFIADVTAGRVYVLKREVKETTDDPALSDILKAYSILERYKRKHGRDPDAKKPVVIGRVHVDTPPVD